MSEPDDFGALRGTEEEPGVVAEIHRQAEAALADPDSLASRRVLSQIFERELDELHTPEGSSFFSEARKPRGEEEQKEREERHLMGAVGRVAGDALRAHGIRVRRVSKDGETEGGGGYVMVCTDGGGREYTARFGLSLAERLVSSGGNANLVERMGQAVQREILSERARYFARMNQPAPP